MTSRRPASKQGACIWTVFNFNDDAPVELLKATGQRMVFVRLECKDRQRHRRERNEDDRRRLKTAS